MATADLEPTPTREPARFEPWPWILIGLLIAMISTSLTLLRIATAHPDGVVGDAWEAGLAFNDELAARQSAVARGVSLSAEAVASTGGAQLVVRIDGTEADAVRVERIRPAESGLDEMIPLRLEDGAWRADVALPAPGRWLLRVEADLDEGRLTRRIGYWHAPAGPDAP